MKYKVPVKIAALVFATLAATDLFATDYTWIGTSSSSWRNSSSWSPSGYPASSNDVAIFNTECSIASTVAPTISAFGTSTAGKIIIANGADITFNGSVVVTNNADIVVQEGGKVTFANAKLRLSAGGRLLVEGGEVTLSDTQYLNAGGCIELRGGNLASYHLVNETTGMDDPANSGRIVVSGGEWYCSPTGTLKTFPNDKNSQDSAIDLEISGGHVYGDTVARFWAYGSSSIAISGGVVEFPAAKLGNYRTAATNETEAAAGTFTLSGGSLRCYSLDTSNPFDAQEISIQGGELMITDTQLKDTDEVAARILSGLANSNFTLVCPKSDPIFSAGTINEINGTLIVTNTTAKHTAGIITQGDDTSFTGSGTILTDTIQARSSASTGYRTSYDGLTLTLYGYDTTPGRAVLPRSNDKMSFTNVTFGIYGRNWKQDNYSIVLSGVTTLDTTDHLAAEPVGYDINLVNLKAGVAATGYSLPVVFKRGIGTATIPSAQLAKVVYIATDSNGVLDLDAAVKPDTGVLDATVLGISKNPDIILQTAVTKAGTVLLANTGWTKVPSEISVIDADGTALEVELDNGALCIKRHRGLILIFR